jgi:hypothetical protein
MPWWGTILIVLGTWALTGLAVLGSRRQYP